MEEGASEPTPKNFLGEGESEDFNKFRNFEKQKKQSVICVRGNQKKTNIFLKISQQIFINFRLRKIFSLPIGTFILRYFKIT